MYLKAPPGVLSITLIRMYLKRPLASMSTSGTFRNFVEVPSAMLAVNIAWGAGYPRTRPLENFPQQALCSWGHVTKFFLEKFYIMGYNLKTARNGKSALKIP